MLYVGIVLAALHAGWVIHGEMEHLVLAQSDQFFFLCSIVAAHRVDAVAFSYAHRREYSLFVGSWWLWCCHEHWASVLSALCLDMIHTTDTLITCCFLDDGAGERRVLALQIKCLLATRSWHFLLALVSLNLTWHFATAKLCLWVWCTDWWATITSSRQVLILFWSAWSTYFRLHERDSYPWFWLPHSLLISLFSLFELLLTVKRW